MPTFQHGKRTYVFVGGYDLSTYFRNYMADRTMDPADTTAFLSTWKTFVSGMGSGKLSLEGMFSGDANGIDAVLQPILGSATPEPFTVVQANGTEQGGFGAAAQIGQGEETTYSVQGSVSEIVKVTADFQATQGLVSGRRLDPAVPITTTGSGSAFDSGASLSYDGSSHPYTTDGGIGVLNLTAISGGISIDVKIQHSATGVGSWADLVDFGSLSAIAGVWALSAFGTQVQRYLRATWIVTGTGSATLCASFGRFSQ